MTEITNLVKEDFINEYKALCEKHGLFVDSLYSDGPYFLRSIDSEFLFWFSDHIDELRKTDIDLHEQED